MCIRDSAIIVVENVNRHLEGGMSPLASASLAARELAGPIVAMTVVLLAVFVPIGFQGGLTGALFVEFAFTLAAAVTVSAVVALTLSPMMCSRLLRAHRPDGKDWETRLVRFIDARFEKLLHWYQRKLERSLRYTPVTAVFVVVVLGCIYFMYTSAKSELAPQEDQGFVLMQATSAPNSTLQGKSIYDKAAFDIASAAAKPQHVFQIDSPSQVMICLLYTSRCV